MTIGFVGLGMMGGKLCRSLVRKSEQEVVVFDLDPVAVGACAQVGATAASSLGEMAARSDVIFTSLPRPKDVRQVALGPGGIAESARPGTVYFDLSTNSYQDLLEVAGRLAEKGVAMLDAPVSGFQAAAEEGAVAVMVGGDKEHFDAHRETIECFGAPEKIMYIGPLGSGLVVKIVNNMLTIAAVAAASEALMLGVTAGIDVETLDAVIRKSTGDSLMYREFADRVLSGNYSRGDYNAPVWPVDLAYKDAHLFDELADHLAVPSPVADAVHNQLRMAKGSGLGALDYTAIVKVYENALQRPLLRPTPSNSAP
jgi:3-hydroxyisobutyrate dehydrogenase-like beta-hydroxyacid dehydrogenase